MNTAKQIALKHAMLKEQEVFFVQAKKDIENGREVYDIEFYSNNVEYDYEIDVKTGKILEADRDIENFSIPAPKTPAPATSGEIGIEKAKQIALNHAGVKAKDAVFVQAKKDYDDGRAVYDIEFKSNGVEYDYEIDPVSGKILSFDVDHDD